MGGKIYHGGTETQRELPKVPELPKSPKLKIRCFKKYSKEAGKASDHPISRSRAITRS
jgi:hypothetical protein